MTRIYTNPAALPTGGTRVLLVGAGHYPATQRPGSRVPKLADLVSVGPGVRELAVRLMRDWREELPKPLSSIDLILSEPNAPAGSVWPALNIAGECPDAQAIEPATLANFKKALNLSLEGAVPADAYIFLCCGHGFWKLQRHFVLADVGTNALNPWEQVLQLDTLQLGLTTTAPRTQWLFFDCCADISENVLNTLGEVGDAVIRPRPSELTEARQTFGPLAVFGMAAASVGAPAFGNKDPARPSRFCEMLLEALSGAGAIARHENSWWVHDRGIDEAIKTYARRTPDLTNPEFYRAAPISSDSADRMWFRRAPEPKSCLVARSEPAHRLRKARVLVQGGGAVVLDSPFGKAKRYLLLPPRQNLQVVAEFPEGAGQPRSVYTDLPLADPDEVIFEV